MNERTFISVNGVRTSMENAKHNVRTWEGFLGTRVELFYNPTEGLAGDGLESLQDRWVGRWFPSELALSLRNRIREEIEQGKEVVVLCHSQGSLLGNTACRHLSRYEKTRVSMVWMASVVQFPIPDIHYLERWRNRWDWVVKILRRPWMRKVGDEYVRGGSGHSLMWDYLSKIREFHGYEKSLLWRVRNEYHESSE